MESFMLQHTALSAIEDSSVLLDLWLEMENENSSSRKFASPENTTLNLFPELKELFQFISIKLQKTNKRKIFQGYKDANVLEKSVL